MRGGGLPDDHLTLKTLWSKSGHYRNRWGKIIAKKHGICGCPLLTSGVGTDFGLGRQQKNFREWNHISQISFHEIAFLAVFNIFPIQKLIFGHFWNSQKWNLVKIIFMSFFGLSLPAEVVNKLKFLLHMECLVLF